MDWTTACPDWRERLRAGRTLTPCDPLFPDEARAALEVFNTLRVVDAAESPTFGDISRPWVSEFVASIFGAYDAASGRRLIREFFLLIAKKNGKSTVSAGIMGTALLRNWRQSGEFLILAPTLEVANNSFFPARDMIKADDELADVLKVQEHLKTISHRVTGATLKVVAADNETVSGKKAIGVLIDELWLFGKRANAENMLREATGGLASRPEGFTVYLSTQSDEPPAGVFKQKLDYFRKVRDGKIDDKRSMPLLYEFPPEMIKSGECYAPQNFGITNPNLGLSVDAEYLADEMRKARDSGEASLCGFAAKHLNVEIGLALGSNAWPGAPFWTQAARPGVTLASILDRCEAVTVGIDGGGLDDLFGLAVVGREKETRKRMTWSRAWAHRKVLDTRKSEAPRLLDFEQQGDLIFVDRMEDAFAGAADIIVEINEAGLLCGVGLDPYGVKGVVDELARRGVEGDDIVVGVPQGFRLQGVIKSVEVALSDGRMEHADQPIMDWCVGNAKIEIKGNAALMTKQASGVAKIDPLMALFDAESLMLTNPESKASLYTAARGIAVFG